MKLYTSLAVIVVACITTPVLPQRWIRQQRQQQQQAQYCVTPENYYGSCVTLSYCPQIANVLQNNNRRLAQQYVIASQRACYTRSFNGDPVVCCTHPLSVPQTQTPFEPQPTTTTAGIFFPTTQPQTSPRNPFTNPPTRVSVSVRPTTSSPSSNRNPFLNPTTRAPVSVRPSPTTAPTRAPTRVTEGPTTNEILIENKAAYCRGPDTREGTCIAIQKCQPIADELRARQTDQVYARFLRASNTICGGVYGHVCCPSTSDQIQSTTSGPSIRNSNQIPKRLPTAEEGCGFSNNSYKKIVGGEVSKRGAWPWIALIGYNDELSSSPFKCGGTLVTARHVITAAHCLRNDLSFVRLGEHDLTKDTEARHVDIRVVRSEKHPDYNRRIGHSDIAILYLERNVQFTEFISPICMPITPELRQRSYVRYTPFVIGWGKTMEGGTSSNVLQELQIPIYDNQVCRDRYQQQNRFFTEQQFDKAVLCAGVLSGGKDTCQGDSGGPLMIPEPYANNVRFYLIGVVSYGIGCARPDIPGVYSSTQYFMDWIIEKVANTP